MQYISWQSLHPSASIAGSQLSQRLRVVSVRSPATVILSQTRKGIGRKSGTTSCCPFILKWQIPTCMYIVLAATLSLAIDFYLSVPERAQHILLVSELRISMGNAFPMCSWRLDLGASVVRPEHKFLARLCMLPIQIFPMRSSIFLTMGKAFPQKCGLFPIPVCVGLCPCGLLSCGLLSGCPPISHTRPSLCSRCDIGKLPLISRPSEGRRLSWPEHSINWRLDQGFRKWSQWLDLNWIFW